jgi:hypothetical protein
MSKGRRARGALRDPITLLLPALLLAATPAFHAEGGLPAELEPAAAGAWEELGALLAAEGVALPPAPRPVRIVPAEALRPGEAGLSRLGVVAVRPGLPAARGLLALRHEVAHQLLLEACPPASGDRLFHEAFALSASGELAAWAAGEEDRGYLPLARALELLDRARARPDAPGLDGPEARRALARLLSESPAPRGRLPPPLARHLSRCEPGAAWSPLTPQELAGEVPAADALVVLSRHSGEVLSAEGAARVPLPFGSTLKPFLLAGAAQPPPTLRPDPSRLPWRCGEGLPPEVDAPTALLRSCNGWFLDWAEREPDVITLGAWGPALLALGLSALPADGAEAIGIRPSLRIPPLGLAHAYRLLAEARPDLLDVLSRNAREGTLAGLPASEALAGVAAKTGTVLDAAAGPRLGLLVAVTQDLVVVEVRAGRPPRSFAADVARTLAQAATPARGAARVQVLGLLPPAEVEGRCAGKGFALPAAGPVAVPEGFAPLLPLADRGPLACAGGPWLVRYPGLREARPYAGILTHEAPPSAPPDRGAEGRPAPTPREARARRGSDLVFRTTRLAYAAGVVEAEDAGLRGEARVALARVADRNGSAVGARHPGRPPCDTTHCQAFRGTAPPRPEDRAALQRPLPPGPFLAFARGGEEPWTAERPATAVSAALGQEARDLRFAGGRVSFLAAGGDAGQGDGARFEERRSLPCELLRGPLKLPACPSRAVAVGDRVRFEGRGEGHGEGLDLEWARRSGLRAAEILERAYGTAGR